MVYICPTTKYYSDYQHEELKMKPLIIGSGALLIAAAKHEKAIKNLIPRDNDVILPTKELAEAYINRVTAQHEYKVTEEISEKFKTITIIAKPLAKGRTIHEVTYPTSIESSTYQLYHDFKHIEFGNALFADLNTLYMLKMSHRFLKNSPHFLKTRKHILNMRRLGAIISNPDWLALREKETYDYAHPNLNVKSKDFFNSNFDYVYDHDTLHEAVKMLDRPAYTHYMVDGEEVNCSKDKFNKCDKSIQVLGVLEETYVLALERSQIPFNFNVDPKKSFDMALEKVCTSITSGWFRDFAWESYDIVQKLYDENYVTKFRRGLELGVVKQAA